MDHDGCHDGILFKDVVRHDGFQSLLRYKDETKNERVNGYLRALAMAKLPKDDPMYLFMEQVMKNMEVPIYMAWSSLCFFDAKKINDPGLLEMVQEKTPKLDNQPESNYEPQKITQAEFRDATGLTEIDLHRYDAITNVTEPVVMTLAARENDIPNGWPQTEDSPPRDKEQIQTGSLVSYLKETLLKADDSLAALTTSAINGTPLKADSRILTPEIFFRWNTEKGVYGIGTDDVIWRKWQKDINADLSVNSKYYKDIKNKTISGWGSGAAKILGEDCKLLHRGRDGQIIKRGDNNWENFPGYDPNYRTADQYFSTCRAYITFKIVNPDSDTSEVYYHTGGNETTAWTWTNPKGNNSSTNVRDELGQDCLGDDGHTKHHTANHIWANCHWNDDHTDYNANDRNGSYRGGDSKSNDRGELCRHVFWAASACNAWCNVARDHIRDLVKSRANIQKAYKRDITSTATGEPPQTNDKAKQAGTVLATGATILNANLEKINSAKWNELPAILEETNFSTFSTIKNIERYRCDTNSNGDVFCRNDDEDENYVQTWNSLVIDAPLIGPVFDLLKTNKYASNDTQVPESWRGQTKLKVFMDTIAAYETAQSAEQEAKADIVALAANGSNNNGLLSLFDDSKITGLPTGNNTPVCQKLKTALNDLKSRVQAAANAAAVAKKQAQAKRLLTEMNILENGYKNWRFDPIEHQSMINAVKSLMIEPGTKNTINSTYNQLIDETDKFEALNEFKGRLQKAASATEDVKKRVQAKILLTLMNTLENGYKNWRFDSIERQGMIDAVKNLMIKSGTTNTINPSYDQFIDEIDKFIKIFCGAGSMLNKIYNYVDQYKVNGSLYSIWRNSTTNSTYQVPYNKDTMVNTQTVSAKVIELQSIYGDWTANSDTRMRLLKVCYEIITGSNFDSDKPQNDTEEAFAASKRDNWGASSLSNSKKAFAYIYKTILDYPILQMQTPAKCIPKVTGTIEDTTLLSTHLIQGTTPTEKVVSVIALTAIERPSDFTAPSQDTIPSAAWESAKIVLNNLKYTGEDSFEIYIKNQSSELESVKMAFIKLHKF
jgi:hypothetical protein